MNPAPTWYEPVAHERAAGSIVLGRGCVMLLADRNWHRILHSKEGYAARRPQTETSAQATGVGARNTSTGLYRVGKSQNLNSGDWLAREGSSATVALRRVHPCSESKLPRAAYTMQTARCRVAHGHTFS